jgi:hypothetical protein
VGKEKWKNYKQDLLFFWKKLGGRLYRQPRDLVVLVVVVVVMLLLLLLRCRLQEVLSLSDADEYEKATILLPT